MKALLALVPMLLVGASDPTKTYFSSGAPPERFQGDVAQVVIYTHDVSQFCGKSSDSRYTIIACTAMKDGVPVTALPNPCQFDSDPYAHLACHEAGHSNGWPADHGA